MGANKIKYVSIKKLWGLKNIHTAINEDVNIFIGDNGTYKTTFLKLIKAALLCDFITLDSIYFENIEIAFRMPGTYLAVVKSGESGAIRYVINSTPIEISPREISQMRIQRQFQSDDRGDPARVRILRRKLQQLVNISWLSINRDTILPAKSFRTDTLKEHDNMDDRLQELTESLIMYQLQLESAANRQMDKFREDALSLMLYDENIDKINPETFLGFDDANMRSMQADLLRAFRALNVAGGKMNRISKHIEKIRDVVDKIKRQEYLDYDDIAVICLINRSRSIIDISKDHQERIKNIFAPVSGFAKCIESFIKGKRFDLGKGSKGGIQFTLNDTPNMEPMGIISLSSGEKQLFILLTEALLQKGNPYLFIADEPELSLHIEWQRRILPELLNMNPNAQIIVATHSPEIAGSYPERVVNMRRIISDDH